MKTILAIWNSGQKGKSETVRSLANLLINNYPKNRIVFSDPTNINSNTDFRLIIEINGKVIGLESQGDPNTGLQKRLEDLAEKHKCDLIFCTARTRGETIHAINNVAKSNHYDIIWTSTYQSGGNHGIMNNIKAEHLLDLVRQLNII